MSNDDDNTNKQLRIYEESGKHLRVSVDEAIARNLNNWQGWQCSAGTRALYIDFSGNLWICNTASSKLDPFNLDGWHKLEASNRPRIVTDSWWEIRDKLGLEYRKSKDAYTKILPNTKEMKEKYFGFLGNIYSDYDLPTEWVLCPWKSCGCGADVILSKSKTNKHKELLQVTNYSWEGKERTLKDITDKITEPVAVEMNFSIPYQILWDIGRRCNYDCHYCWPAVHNRTDSHKDYNLIINTIDNLVTNWANDDKIRWNFGGGEPTLHPRFLDILKHLSNKNQWVMVTTNGTRDHKYWKEAAQYINSVNFSAHFDGLISDKEENRFVKNIETVCEHFNIHNDDHWAEVKIMSPPKYIDRAIKLKEKINGMGLLNKIGANNRINGYVSLVPIRSLGNSGELVEYTPEQLEIFKHQ